jgi:hypothetical protein
MNNIEDILRALTEDSADEQSGSSHENGESGESQNESGGLFDGLDIDMLMKIMSLFENMNKPDDNERFLLALKPLLKEENRGKIDSAVRFMKLFSLIPVLKESGMFDKMF